MVVTRCLVNCIKTAAMLLVSPNGLTLDITPPSGRKTKDGIHVADAKRFM